MFFSARNVPDLNPGITVPFSGIPYQVARVRVRLSKMKIVPSQWPDSARTPSMARLQDVVDRWMVPHHPTSSLYNPLLALCLCFASHLLVRSSEQMPAAMISGGQGRHTILKKRIMIHQSSSFERAPHRLIVNLP